MRSRFCLLLLGPLLLACAAHAQTAPLPATPALAPAQAQQVLDLLRDDKRRAEFVATLDAIAKAAPAPAAPPGLEPDSLGAQLVSRASAAVADAGSQLLASLRAVNDLPLLWRWIVAQATDPEARAQLAETGWKTLTVLLCGLLVDWATRRLLRPMQRTLANWAPHSPEADTVPESGLAAAEAGETESAHHREKAARAMGALRRLPYLLGRLLLDLLPILLFAVVAELLSGTRLGQPARTGQVIMDVVSAYALCRGLLAIAALLVSPAVPRLRLLHVSDWAASFLTRWTRRVVVVAVVGYALSETGLRFGMYRTAHDAVLKLFALAIHVCLVVAVLQAREPVAARLHARRTARGAWTAVLNRFAEIWHWIAIFYIMALWLVWAVELRNGYIRLIQFCVVTLVVLVVARLVGVVLLGGLDRLRSTAAGIAPHSGLEERAGFYYPVVRSILNAALVVATVFALLEAWGFAPISWFGYGGLGGRIVSALLLIGVTVVIAVLVWELANAGIERHLARLSATAQLARAGRLRTLLPMLRTVLLVTIVLVVTLMALSEVGVNIAPLLAGAGVIGIAVGFGSQKLVQDLITGLFLLLENAMQVGDVVTLGGLTGTVEALSIRTIRLRATDGAVHLIPFSAVTTVTNQTRDYSYAVLDVSVGLNEEPDAIAAVLTAVADEMRSDPDWQNIVLEKLDVMGVERFVDTAWIMRVRMKTQPSSRWAVVRELNRRIKRRFDALAVESPFTSYRVLSNHPAPPESIEEKAA